MSLEVCKMASNSHCKARTPRRHRLALPGVCLIALATFCQAKNNCAWINEATASGLLGGDAEGEFTEASAGQPAVCAFTQNGAGVTRTLPVTVEQAPDGHARLESVAQACGGDVAPLKAIGNEALMCAADDRKGALGERVVGRVRDQIFTITIGTTLKGDPLLTREALKARIYTAAEQVSGNLF
jgi:hypothetical protein